MSAEERTVRVIKADKSSENSTLRVAAYCRVSTSEEDQLNSFITQCTIITILSANRIIWFW